jgi:hypothetical protein
LEEKNMTPNFIMVSSGHNTFLALAGLPSGGGHFRFGRKACPGSTIVRLAWIAGWPEGGSPTYVRFSSMFSGDSVRRAYFTKNCDKGSRKYWPLGRLIPTLDVAGEDLHTLARCIDVSSGLVTLWRGTGCFARCLSSQSYAKWGMSPVPCFPHGH